MEKLFMIGYLRSKSWMVLSIYKLWIRLLNFCARRIYSKRIGKVGINFNCYYDLDIVGGKYISIGNNFTSTQSVRLHAWEDNDDMDTIRIEIGNDVTITDHCYISGINKISIGNGVLFGSNCFVSDNFHGNAKKDDLDSVVEKRVITSKGAVVIGDNVWIGRNACIMPNVTIGKGVIIGANSVVTHDIPPYSVVAGVPARIISKSIISEPQ